MCGQARSVTTSAIGCLPGKSFVIHTESARARSPLGRGVRSAGRATRDDGTPIVAVETLLGYGHVARAAPIGEQEPWIERPRVAGARRAHGKKLSAAARDRGASCRVADR